MSSPFFFIHGTQLILLQYPPPWSLCSPADLLQEPDPDHLRVHLRPKDGNPQEDVPKGIVPFKAALEGLMLTPSTIEIRNAGLDGLVKAFPVPRTNHVTHLTKFQIRNDGLGFEQLKEPETRLALFTRSLCPLLEGHVFLAARTRTTLFFHGKPQ